MWVEKRKRNYISTLCEVCVWEGRCVCVFPPLPILHCFKGQQRGPEVSGPDVNAIHQALTCNGIKMMWVLLTRWQNAPQAILIDSQTKLDKRKEKQNTSFFFCLLEPEHNLKRKPYTSLFSSNVLFIGVGFGIERERERVELHCFQYFHLYFDISFYDFMIKFSILRAFKNAGATVHSITKTKQKICRQTELGIYKGRSAKVIYFYLFKSWARTTCASEAFLGFSVNFIFLLGQM